MNNELKVVPKSLKNQQGSSIEKQEQFSVPVTFIWYGPQVPEDYMIRLSSLPYPVQFFKNPKIGRSFNRKLKLIQQADYYRLQYIYNYGGIYSDFDNQIDYKCMSQVLQSYKQSEKVIFWWQPKRNAQSRNVVPNSFIYAPRPKMQSMKRILQEVNQQYRQLKFAGMEYLAQFANKQLVQVKELYNCIQHEYDFSWVKESGKTDRNRKDKQQLVNKKRKKIQIINQLQKVKRENTELQREYQILKDKYKETEEKLMKEYKSHYVEDQGQKQKLKQNQKAEQITQEIKQVIMNSQISPQELRKNTQLTSSINNNIDTIKTKNTQRRTKHEGPYMINQKQSIQENTPSPQRLTKNYQPQQNQAYAPPSSPLSSNQPISSASNYIYAGQSMRLVDAQKQVKNQKIRGKIQQYKMDDSKMQIMIIGVIGVILLFIVGFIWAKFKKYQKYAQVEFQLDRRLQTERKESEKRKQIMNQRKVQLEKSINEEKQSLKVRQ